MKIKYRPEIDGLRAIAVGAIILYHSKLNLFNYQLFQGGFIGVDIFFVISGYLITTIILKEIILKYSFSFKNFYERRLRRILPALLFVMLLSFPFAWIHLLPDNFSDYSKSIIFSQIFSSNLFFHYTDLDYGGVAGQFKPFLHTWSLSVEEQYYIFFPVILFIVYKFLNKYLINILLLCLVISLFLADWSSRNYPSASFYFIHTRIWEFLTGSVLAYFEIKKGEIEKKSFFYSILPPLGILLISYSIFFFHNKINHPSFYTLIPVIGVCLIIFFAHKDELVTKILSTKLFVGIGLISYSLYLWHYPIFTLTRISSYFENSIIKSLFLFFVILILSIFTYYFIEKPFRNKKNNRSVILVTIFFLFIIVCILNLITLYNEGFKQRTHFPKVVLNTLATNDYRLSRIDGLSCHNRLGKEGFCIYNQLDRNDGDIVLLGDSLTDALLKNMIEEVSKTKYRLVHLSYSGNLYLENFIKFDKNLRRISQSEDFHFYRKNFLEKQSNKNTFVIFYGDYNRYFEKGVKLINNKIVEFEERYIYSKRANIDLERKQRKKLLKKELEKTLLNLSKNFKVLLLYPSPSAPVSILDHIKKNKKKIYNDKNFYLNDKINYSKKFYDDYNSEIISLFDQLKIDNLYKIKLDKIFCPKQQCIFYDNEYSYIFDFVHPSYEGSKKINNLIMKEINKFN